MSKQKIKNKLKEPDVLYTVPDSMQRLVRFTVRGFYGIEHGLAIDVLVRNPCVKEEDIQRVLKFDRKVLRAIVNQLKSDKFLRSRQYVETQDNGKVSRHNYFFINYRSIANIIKYKLHKMHKIIETRERDLSNRPSFKCPTCESTYDDLDVNQLINELLGTLNCVFCKAEVIEEKDTANSQDIRTSQARFNEQTEVLYKLLKDVEGVKLSDEILDPKPSTLNLNMPGKSTGRMSKKSGEPNWTRKPDSYIGPKQNIFINIGDDKNTDEAKNKETPKWITESTVMSGHATDLMPGVSDAKVARMDDDAIDDVASSGAARATDDNNEVMLTLLVNERPSKPTAASNAAVASTSAATTLPRTEVSSDDEDAFDDVDEEEELMVTVAGKPYSYHEVASRGQELIKLMSESEKTAYIEMGQRFYQDLND